MTARRAQRSARAASLATAYFEATRSRPPSALLERAIALARFGDALELGSGGGAAARRLNEAGFRVTAVDIEASARRYVSRGSHPAIRFLRADIADLEPGPCQLIHAQDSLPFLGARLARVLPRLVAALRPGGVLAAQFFGVRHAWRQAPGRGLAFHTATQIRRALRGLEIVVLTEEESEQVAFGHAAPIHWHALHVLAYRRHAATLDDVLAYRNERVVRSFAHATQRTRAESRLLFQDMLKLLWLAHRGIAITLFPFQRPLDEMWHTFILHTRDYEQFCMRYFGRMIHHAPESVAAAPPARRADPIRLLTQMIRLVDRHLGRRTATRWYREFAARYSGDDRTTRTER